MTPLERAARALHKDYIEGRIRMGVARVDLPAWEDLGPDGEFSFYAPARAVIAAIREPSPAMEAAWVGNSGGSTAKRDWQAMIDAMLEENQA